MASGDSSNGACGFQVANGRRCRTIARERIAAATAAAVDANSSAIAEMIKQMYIRNANTIREEVEQKKEKMEQSLPMTNDMLVGDDDRLKSNELRHIQMVLEEMWKKELDRRDAMEMCTMCHNRKVDKSVLLPCGHANTCEECATKITRCTLCQQNVSFSAD